jgi:hypothetical protein
MEIDSSYPIPLAQIILHRHGDTFPSPLILHSLIPFRGPFSSTIIFTFFGRDGNERHTSLRMILTARNALGACIFVTARERILSILLPGWTLGSLDDTAHSSRWYLLILSPHLAHSLPMYWGQLHIQRRRGRRWRRDTPNEWSTFMMEQSLGGMGRWACLRILS